MRIIPDRDKWRNWYLDEDAVYILTNGDVLRIDKGYRFDGHSVPFIFRWIFPRYDKSDIEAAMIHDYIIDTMPWTRYNRKFADAQYKHFMHALSTNYFRRNWMPVVVRMYGYLRYDIWGDYRGYMKYKTSVYVKVIESEMI